MAKASTTKKVHPNTRKKVDVVELQTQAGHPLTVQEARFIDSYLKDGNRKQAVLDAGYKTSTPSSYATVILAKAYIQEEIAYRLNQSVSDGVASANEVLLYFTKVMRGEIKDQFGLEASLSERTKAAQELAKRLIDIPNKASQGDTSVNVYLDWNK